MVMKPKMSDKSIKQIAMLQMIAIRLFGGEAFVETIRLKLRKEEKMNYRHVLDMKELLLQKMANQIQTDEFQAEYCRNLRECQELRDIQAIEE